MSTGVTRSRNRWYSVVAVLACLPSQVFADAFHVDNANPSASDSNPGTFALPYRTISAAVVQRAAPGNTIVVHSGNYPERITVAASGRAGAPITVQSAGLVTVDGADDYSATSRWTHVTGSVWLARDVASAPVQVFADGARLDPSSAPAASLPSRTFRYVSNAGLYVNVGGANPGTHGTRVGLRSNGFVISGRSHVTVDGFRVTRTESDGIHLVASSQCVISNNEITFAGAQGIHVAGGNAVTVAGNSCSDHRDHGIALSNGVTQSVIRDNASFRNARRDVRAARGIQLTGCSNNRIERNRLYDNQDSGLQINTDSDNNVCVQNLSWNNGDHGMDHLGSTGTIHIGDVTYGNFNDGFSIEGASKNTRLYDCIGMDNGITTGHYDLWVDAESTNGFQSDYNIFWNSTGAPPVRYVSTYATVAAYSAASGKDQHSTHDDPRFVAPHSGDFRLLPGSPAIDAGTSAPPQWPAMDFAGRPRGDIPGVPNLGAGAVPFADRGAFEFMNAAPTAALVATPANGTGPLLTTADGSGSTDDGTIVSYRFDFGDGTVVGPQAAPIATHVYAAGAWELQLTVVDDGGASATTTRLVSVANPDHAPVVTAPPIARWHEGALLTIAISAVDPDGQPITSLTADLSRLPAGHDARFLAGEGNATGTFSWTPTYADAGSHAVTFHAANALTGTATMVIPVQNMNLAPVPALSVMPFSGFAPLLVTAHAAGSTDDGTIVSYRFDFGDGTSAGPQTSPVAAHSYAPGTWTLEVTVTDDGGFSSSTSRLVTAAADHAPTVIVAESAHVNESEPLSIVVSAEDADGHPITTLSADLSALPEGHGATFTTAAGNSTGTLAWTPTHEHAGTYPVTFRATNALAATAVCTVTVVNEDRPPVFHVSAIVKGLGGIPLELAITASDPDGDPIASLVADLSRLPMGNDAVFAPDPEHTVGLLSWTPTLDDFGNYTVTFTAANAWSTTTTVKLQVRSRPGNTNPLGAIPGEESGGPRSFAFLDARPNPASAGVSFVIDLPRAERVECTIHDLQGRIVWEESRELPAGRQSLRWEPPPRSERGGRPGLYFARVRAGGRSQMQRIVRL